MDRTLCDVPVLMPTCGCFISSAPIVGGKWVCVVIKYAAGDAFVVTAYLTSRAKAGEDLWQTK